MIQRSPWLRVMVLLSLEILHLHTSTPDSALEETRRAPGICMVRSYHLALGEVDYRCFTILLVIRRRSTFVAYSIELSASFFPISFRFHYVSLIMNPCIQPLFSTHFNCKGTSKGPAEGRCVAKN
ncbi:hypothetical protein CPB83DRAFT_865299 [Crepidotus variabilis]|uniref:Secreted protein n=1 Tax=Crepidotus variabilis TaxID=179855 RepID=A0A9P6E3C9_9AGAR|nr:hypothetical protein CPB83DRAFT_865299 [Crepidotus variabilis]